MVFANDFKQLSQTSLSLAAQTATVSCSTAAPTRCTVPKDHVPAIVFALSFRAVPTASTE